MDKLDRILQEARQYRVREEAAASGHWYVPFYRVVEHFTDNPEKYAVTMPDGRKGYDFGLCLDEFIRRPPTKWGSSED